MDLIRELEKYAPHIAIGTGIGIPTLLTAFYYLIPPAPARLGFEERKLEGEYSPEVVPLWREANSVYSSRLGWGRNILVGNFIEIVPDVDGDFRVDWWFRNFVDTTKVWEVSYTQTITGLKAGVSSGKVLLTDQNSLAAYDYWTNFDNENLYSAYKTYGVPRPNTAFTCKHRAGGTVTSPSGQVFTLAEAEWSDTMQYKLPPLTATLSFSERKLT